MNELGLDMAKGLNELSDRVQEDSSGCNTIAFFV
jgi:hypothetical protein